MIIRKFSTLLKKTRMSRLVAIIGGGPVGLFLAIKLSKLGHKVTLYEKKKWPIDKVCGQGIMPGGVKILEDLGIMFQNGIDSYDFTNIEYLDQEISINGYLNASAKGVKRSILSQKLYQFALSCEQLTLVPLSTLVDIKVTVDEKVEIKLEGINHKPVFDFVFACDGLHSKVRKITNHERCRKGPYRMGARVHYSISPWAEGVQVYWDQSVEAYVTPVSTNQIEIAFLWYQDIFSKEGQLIDKLLDRFPLLIKKLNNAKPDSDFKAYGPFKFNSSTIHKDNIFYIGDCYKFLDGITGEGLSLGFKQANIISENFENFNYFDSMRIKLLYLNYGLWVNLCLILSRNKKIRSFLFYIVNKWPGIFNFILKLNDF
jgi:menaquinone-9 beta-reductase